MSNTVEAKRCHLWQLEIESEGMKIPSFVLNDCTIPNWSVDDTNEVKYTQLSCTLTSTNQTNTEKLVLDMLKNAKANKIKITLKMLTSVGETASVWTMDGKFSSVRFAHLDYQSVEPFFVYLDFMIDTMTID